VIVVDESKLSPRLGTHWALPVEVVEFGWRSHARFLEYLGAKVIPRQVDGTRFVTDQGNIILDSDFGPIADAPGLASALAARAGIVEHGLFIGTAQDLFVAGETGVRHVRRGG
jgi:ribose 5-phosphate isomerase A